jgi:hypothetical protein
MLSVEKVPTPINEAAVSLQAKVSREVKREKRRKKENRRKQSKAKKIKEKTKKELTRSAYLVFAECDTRRTWYGCSYLLLEVTRGPGIVVCLVFAEYLAQGMPCALSLPRAWHSVKSWLAEHLSFAECFVKGKRFTTERRPRPRANAPSDSPSDT